MARCIHEAASDQIGGAEDAIRAHAVCEQCARTLGAEAASIIWRSRHGRRDASRDARCLRRIGPSQIWLGRPKSDPKVLLIANQFVSDGVSLSLHRSLAPSIQQVFWDDLDGIVPGVGKWSRRAAFRRPAGFRPDRSRQYHMDSFWRPASGSRDTFLRRIAIRF
jgi:hypothetical protein